MENPLIEVRQSDDGSWTISLDGRPATPPLASLAEVPDWLNGWVTFPAKATLDELGQPPRAVLVAPNGTVG